MNGRTYALPAGRAALTAAALALLPLAAAAEIAPPRVALAFAPEPVVALWLDSDGGAPRVVARTMDGAYHALAPDQRTGITLTPLEGHRPPRAERLPDMLPESRAAYGGGRIAVAHLAGPSRPYKHGALGEQIAAASLRVQLRDGTALAYELGPDSVFADLMPRLVDVTGDGESEIVVVRSYLDRGAALAVFALRDGGLRLLAETEPLGAPDKWLNPAAVGDFSGEGRREIAFVATPHDGGTLHLAALDGDRLRLRRSAPGFSNHQKGSRELGLAAALDANRNGVLELALPSAARDELVIVSFAGGTFRELARVPHTSEIATAIFAVDVDGDGRAEIVYGLANGMVVVLFL